MSHQPKPIYEFGLYRLDAAERLLLRDGDVVPLQPKVFDLLLALLEHHGRLAYDELMVCFWEAGLTVRLRQAGLPKNSRHNAVQAIQYRSSPYAQNSSLS